MIKTALYMLAMSIIFAIQLPAYLVAKVRGKSYQWWGGPQ